MEIISIFGVAIAAAVLAFNVYSAYKLRSLKLALRSEDAAIKNLAGLVSELNECKKQIADLFSSSAVFRQKLESIDGNRMIALEREVSRMGEEVRSIQKYFNRRHDDGGEQ